MSFERFPATRLSQQVRLSIQICEAIGLVVKSEVRVQGGVLAEHTITSADGSEIFLKAGYSRDLFCFTSGIVAANSKHTKPYEQQH